MANRFKRYKDKKKITKKPLGTCSNLHKPPEQDPKSKKKHTPKIPVLRGFKIQCNQTICQTDPVDRLKIKKIPYEI